MMKLSPSMRMIVNRDTFFLPDPKGSVYFRNNAGSFKMEGKSIDQWVEKLLPMYNGDFTLGQMTEGLPGPYRDRVFEITETLYKNGFLRDLSQDSPHQLKEEILKKYAHQIEFLNSFGGSGAFRFQEYRKTKVLAIGSGPIFVSLVSALLESGLPTFHTLITDSMTTNRKRLSELTMHARKTDPEVAIHIISQAERGNSWDDVIEPFDGVVYVSQQGELEELRTVQSACEKGKKMFIPAVCIDGYGVVGPVTFPGSEGCWSSAWQSIHKTVFERDQVSDSCSSTAGAMLTNICAFEMFKKLTDVAGRDRPHFYLLDLYTLEGKWHAFLPHPNGQGSVEWLEEKQFFEKTKRDPSNLFTAFSQMTSNVSGVFHRWEEGDLNQTLLSQCEVQVVDPLSDGPSELLPPEICGGLTHEEARREAGLVGLETYGERFIEKLQLTNKLETFIGIGAGETNAEGVYRGLQKCLLEELRNQTENHQFLATPLNASAIEDDHCRFLLQSLKTMGKEPRIYLGKESAGFPVIWLEMKNKWYGSVGLDLTIALRNTLKHAVMKGQNKKADFSSMVIEQPFITVNETNPSEFEVLPSDMTESLQNAKQVFKKSRRTLNVFQLPMEPLLQKEQAVLVGVMLRKEAPLL
ncbi:putative thiazole-containing bacteriocin maturation protein [Pseudalkalibacillus sp. A8]|uniref:putative thiazole-containing bacteriocin maturation protein n=1 Tax=Pseudalkalibacillus sp. A8 TaxID=3382641 RepID=UPI0038B4E38E